MIRPLCPSGREGEGSAPVEAIEVVAAVIERDGRILIARRLAGIAPGRAVGVSRAASARPGETPEAALRREIREELGAAVTVGEPIETVEWRIPDKRVRLSFFRCADRGGAAAAGGPGDRAGWRRASCGRYQFPAADAALIARLSRG